MLIGQLGAGGAILGEMRLFQAFELWTSRLPGAGIDLVRRGCLPRPAVRFCSRCSEVSAPRELTSYGARTTRRILTRIPAGIGKA